MQLESFEHEKEEQYSPGAREGGKMLVEGVFKFEIRARNTYSLIIFIRLRHDEC